jgi:adenine-specific DNA-methyltransferase
MPTLDWLNRADAFTTAAKVPYRLLEPVSSHGDPAAKDNLLIQGDNLEALKALLPFYRGQVKCIFIDPPYNTGSAFEHYDDDLEHAQWLSMMLPRLQLLRELLSEDGFMCVHLDDSEGHYLKVMTDEIFGRNHYLVTIYPVVRYADKTLKQDMDFHKRVEQLHIYRKSRLAKPNRPTETLSFDKYVFKIEELAKPSSIQQLNGKEVHIFKKGTWRIEKTSPGVDGLKEIWATGTILDGNSSGRFFRDCLTGRAAIDGLGTLYKVEDIGDDGQAFRYFTGPNKESATKGKYFQGVPLGKREIELSSSSPIDNSYDYSGAFGNCRTEGGAEFRGGKKPEAYLQLVIETLTDEGDLVLDSFLGSGTTAATAHKLRRRWIGIEMRAQALTHCLPRLQKVVDGEQGGISKAVSWQGGGGFRFMRLGEPVFDAQGRIHSAVRFATLAAFVWQQETHSAFDPAQAKPGTPYLGTHYVFNSYLSNESEGFESISLVNAPLQANDACTAPNAEVDLFSQAPAALSATATHTPASASAQPGAAPANQASAQSTAYYLLYNGILGDKRPASGNVLTHAVLDALLQLHTSTPRPDAPLVVYGEACRLGAARLLQANVTFKHIPYDVKAR